MNIVIKFPALERTFTDTERLEHLYAAIAFMVNSGKINPLALSLRLPQLDGSEVDITLNEVMNQARRVIDNGYLLGPDLSKLRRYEPGSDHGTPVMEQDDDGAYVRIEDVRQLLQGG